MAEYKVDKVQYREDKSGSKLTVWVFNDPSYYAPNAQKFVAKYNFGRKPNNEDGTPADKKTKLMPGLYREPFKDGWKYVISIKVQPKLTETVMRYINWGWKKDDDGELVPCTYLRHNRKAFGIHYLIESYLNFYNDWLKYIPEKRECKSHVEADFPPFYYYPYFPTDSISDK